MFQHELHLFPTDLTAQTPPPGGCRTASRLASVDEEVTGSVAEAALAAAGPCREAMEELLGAGVSWVNGPRPCSVLGFFRVS